MPSEIKFLLWFCERVKGQKEIRGIFVAQVKFQSFFNLFPDQFRNLGEVFFCLCLSYLPLCSCTLQCSCAFQCKDSKSVILCLFHFNFMINEEAFQVQIRSVSFTIYFVFRTFKCYLFYPFYRVECDCQISRFGKWIQNLYKLQLISVSGL